jgi:NADPH:quinone reductase-like Zn-dependent oxidoreductase
MTTARKSLKSRKATIAALRAEIDRLCAIISSDVAHSYHAEQALHSAEEHLRDLTAKDRLYTIHAGPEVVATARGRHTFDEAVEMSERWGRTVTIVDHAMGRTVGGVFFG